MNIFEMLSFDFKEFATSTAGILIIVGIVCLLVGIVLFLKEGKKKPTEVSEEKPAEAPAPEATTEAPKEESAPLEVATLPEATPAVEAAAETAPVVVPSEGDGVKEVEVAPVAETINFSEPATEAPVVEDLKPETLDMPTVEPVEAPAVTPVVTPVESLDAEPETQPTIYGGASPEVSKPEILEEKPREIYGGANPLENTAPIPTVAETSSEAPAVTPVAEPETEAPTAAPVEEPATEAPAAAPEPVTEAPAVAPAAEPETEAPTAAPVAEPAVAEKKEEIEKLEF